MAWQAYVEQLLGGIDGQHLAAAAILGHDGAVRAQSSNFPQVKPEEISAVMKDFDEPGSLDSPGLSLGGTKYMIIQGDSGSVIRAKKGLGGVTIKKTNQSIVIGIYEAPMHAAQCNVVVENFGDYLVAQGY